MASASTDNCKQHRVDHGAPPPPSAWYFAEHKLTRDTFDVTTTQYRAAYAAFEAWDVNRDDDTLFKLCVAVDAFLKHEEGNIANTMFVSRVQCDIVANAPLIFGCVDGPLSIFGPSALIVRCNRQKTLAVSVQDFPLTSEKTLRIAFSGAGMLSTFQRREQSLSKDVQSNQTLVDRRCCATVRDMPYDKTIVICAPSGCGKTLNGMLVGAGDVSPDGWLTSVVLYTTFAGQQRALDNFEASYRDRATYDPETRNAAAAAIVQSEIVRLLDANGFPSDATHVVRPPHAGTVVLLLDEVGSRRAFARAVIGARQLIQTAVESLTGASQVRVMVAGTGITAHDAAIGSQCTWYYVWKPNTETVWQTLFESLPRPLQQVLTAPMDEMAPEVQVASAMARQNARVAALIMIELKRVLTAPDACASGHAKGWHRLVGAAVHSATLRFKELNGLQHTRLDRYMATVAAAAASAFFVTLPDDWFRRYAGEYGLLHDRALAVYKTGDLTAGDTNLSAVTDPPLFVPSAFNGQRFDVMECNVLMAAIVEGFEAHEASTSGFVSFTCDFLRWLALMGLPFQMLLEKGCVPVTLPAAAVGEQPPPHPSWLTPSQYFVTRVGPAQQHPRAVRLEPLKAKIELAADASTSTPYRAIARVRGLVASSSDLASPHDVIILNGAMAQFADVLWVRGGAKELVLVQCKHYPSTRLSEAQVHAELTKMGYPHANVAFQLVAELQRTFPRPPKSKGSAEDAAWKARVCDALREDSGTQESFVSDVMVALSNPTHHWAKLREVLGKPENVGLCARRLELPSADVLLAELKRATGTTSVRWLIVVCGLAPEDVVDPTLLSAINAHEVSLVHSPPGSSADHRLGVFFPVGAPVESYRPSCTHGIEIC